MILKIAIKVHPKKIWAIYMEWVTKRNRNKLKKLWGHCLHKAPPTFRTSCMLRSIWNQCINCLYIQHNQLVPLENKCTAAIQKRAFPNECLWCTRTKRHCVTCVIYQTVKVDWHFINRKWTKCTNMDSILMKYTRLMQRGPIVIDIKYGIGPTIRMAEFGESRKNHLLSPFCV